LLLAGAGRQSGFTIFLYSLAPIIRALRLVAPVAWVDSRSLRRRMGMCIGIYTYGFWAVLDTIARRRSDAAPIGCRPVVLNWSS
jgi:hypothetical protein